MYIPKVPALSKIHLGSVEAMKMTDADLFPNVRKLLLIETTSPISSSEAERVTMLEWLECTRVRMLKTMFR